MSSVAERRENEVAEVMAFVRSMAEPVDVSRENLDKIKQVMLDFASRADIWDEEEFPAPEEGKIQNRYLISKDDDDSYALYLNVMNKGKYAPPHNHTTWACVTAVAGEEYNYVYTPEQEGPLEPGERPIKHTETINVKPGQGIALLKDDIHAIEIKEGMATRHLHLYGRALETLTKRMTWDKDLQNCFVYEMDIPTIK